MDGRNRLSEFDRALADALDVDVSPDFVARVHRRIAREPQPAAVWRVWRIALPIAAGVAGVIAAVVLTRAPAAPPGVAPLTARALSVELLRPAEWRASRPVRRIEVRPPVPLVEATAAAAEPEVLIPPEEIEMYRRLIAAAQAVRTPAVVEVWNPVPAELSISAIQIDPIRIDLIAPPVGGEGDRR